MSTRLKHTDDDGDLSIFVSGDQVLFACNNGHAWTAQLSVESCLEQQSKGVVAEGITSTHPGAA
jgi:hypothetical protein